MKGFKSTSTNPYTYTQSGVWRAGQYTFQAVVLSDSGYAFAFQRSDTTWQTVDLSWQVKEGSYSKIQWTFTLEADAVAFRLIANTVTGETIVVQPMLEKGSNGSTPIAHEEDLRGMDGDNHEFIFTRNDTGIAPPTPLSTQEDDYTPVDDSVEPPVIWTDNPQGVTKELPFEFVSMREKKNGVWLNFSPPSLWAKWAEDGLSVNLLVEGHYNSHWEGTTKVVEIVGGVDVGGSEVVKVSAVFRKGEENIAATVSQSRGFQWYVNGVHLTAFDNQPFITLDETYGDGFADYVVLSYLVNSIREEERQEIINISEGMDGIGEEFIFKANNSDTVPPVLPQTTDVGYQDDDYHGDWSDDPVAPTEANQFVWVAKRKKVGGIWEAFGDPSVWTRWAKDGEDGITIIPSQQGYTYRADLNGDIIGSLANGMVELTIMNGSTPITCSSATSGGTPTTNGTYRVTRTLGNGITTNSSVSGGKYRITPATLTVDEASVELEIKIMMDGVVTSYPLTLTYRKQFDGADGKSTEFIFKGHTSDTTAPTLPSTSQQDDWYGQGTAYEWDDDLVEPTKSLPYVWASQRKKVDGVWGAFTTPKVWLRYPEDGKDAKSLILSASSLTMKCNPDNTPQTGQTISIEAKLQNVSGTATFAATPYNDAGAALTAITLGGSGNTRTLTSSQWLSTFQKVVITATLSGLSDTVTITRLSDGGDGEPAKSIHLNPSAKAISITKGNIPVPASVTVTGTAVNTTIQYWYYSANGAASFTGAPPTGVTRSGNQVTINSATARFKTLSIKARNSTDDVEDVVTITRGGGAPYVDSTTRTWWTWNEELGIYTDTGMSPVGSDGRIPYPAGYWEAKTYTRDANYAPYVQHTEAIYLLVDDLAEPTDVPGTSNKWKVFNTWTAVFVDSLVAAFANIGGAVFTGNTDPSSPIRGRLISERGVDGTSNFSSYTGDDGTWQPKLMLDFLNGAAKVGDFIIEQSGRIVMVDPATGIPRLVFSVQNISTINDLMNETEYTATVNNTAKSNITTYYELPNPITVEKDGSRLTFSATVSLEVSGLATGAMGELTVWLVRDGSLYELLFNNFLEVQPGEENGISVGGKTLDSVPSGTYTVSIVVTDHYGTGSVVGSITNSTLSYYYRQQGVKRQQYGKDGMMFFYSDHHFHFTESGGMDGRALPNKWNAPGVLLSGSVGLNGGFTSWWGAKKHLSYTATKNSTGRYTVYHSVGHSNYQINATPATANKSCYIVSKGTDNFVIEWRTIGSSPALSDTNFDFQITGNNY